MGFEDFVLAHAKVSSAVHLKVTIEDKMTFFQQLSTLVCSGTPLHQSLRQAAGQGQSKKFNAGRQRRRRPGRRRQLLQRGGGRPTPRSSSPTGSRSSGPAR